MNGEFDTCPICYDPNIILRPFLKCEHGNSEKYRSNFDSSYQGGISVVYGGRWLHLKKVELDYLLWYRKEGNVHQEASIQYGETITFNVGWHLQGLGFVQSSGAQLILLSEGENFLRHIGK